MAQGRLRHHRAVERGKSASVNVLYKDERASLFSRSSRSGYEKDPRDKLKTRIIYELHMSTCLYDFMRVYLCESVRACICVCVCVCGYVRRCVCVQVNPLRLSIFFILLLGVGLFACE